MQEKTLEKYVEGIMTQIEETLCVHLNEMEAFFQKA